MNDLTLKTGVGVDLTHPYATVFAIEQRVFRQRQRRVLDALEKGLIKFHYKQTLDPHEAPVQSVYEDEGGLYSITGSLLNLTGANGVLPNHYSETLAKTLRDKNTVFKDFLDMFNHRLSSLMYRSWAKYRLDTDRAYKSGVKQYSSTVDLIMTSLAGESFPAKDNTAAYFNGLTFVNTKSAEKIKNIISEVSGLDVTINEFKGKWIELDNDDLSRMGTRESQHYNQLGVSTMLGRRCWDLSSGFEVEFEVDDKDTFKRLTPGGDMNQRLRSLLQQLVGRSFEFSFKLKVKESHCQRVQLSKESQTHLGANAWMSNGTSNNRIIDYYC